MRNNTFKYAISVEISGSHFANTLLKAFCSMKSVAAENIIILFYLHKGHFSLYHFSKEVLNLILSFCVVNLFIKLQNNISTYIKYPAIFVTNFVTWNIRESFPCKIPTKIFCYRLISVDPVSFE